MKRGDKRRHNPGRPKTEGRGVRHTVWISAEADTLLRADAAREGVTVAEWWRRAVLAGAGRTLLASTEG